MKQNVFKLKLKEVIDIINQLIDDSELKEQFNTYFSVELEMSDQNKSFELTIQGILGFYNFFTSGKCTKHDFLINSIHDLSEYLRNGHEKWFSPRLSRFAK